MKVIDLNQQPREEWRQGVLRTRPGAIASGEGFWADRIIPLAVEVVACEVDGVQFGIGHLDASRIGVLIEFATNRHDNAG